MVCIQAHVIISGRVQGVGFRADVQTKARSLGISGWVRNRPDGKVEALFEGDQPRVHEMVEWVQQGPALAYVMHVNVKYDTCRNRFAEFEII